ncbi:uncharacterized protein LOC142338605 [Convolutriloba macropyga]|uniref:uncharacterized protein LOC142338605 n=1 Tax=Convolutriloba macropyga TaxID=536237 RepID=UPI003F521BD5
MKAISSRVMQLLVLLSTEVRLSWGSSLPSGSSKITSVGKGSAFIPTYYFGFVLPGRFDYLGAKCNMFSRHFCLLGFLSDELGSRKPTREDGELFYALISQTYMEMNWFSFKAQDRVNHYGCCTFQVNTYMEQGQSFGFSPVEYFEIVYNLGTTLPSRDLVYIKARRDPSICMNVIEQIGFGQGPFKILSGQHASENYTLPPLGNDGEEVLVIPGYLLTHRLTFNWFRLNVICKDQPRFCLMNTRWKRGSNSVKRIAINSNFRKTFHK